MTARGRSPRRPAGTAALALALALPLAAALPACRRAALEAEGRRLFAGELPLPARLAGDDVDLPAQASRCANCHLTEAAAPEAGTAVATQTFGPALDGPSLVLPRARRGGPPSRYDLGSFCKLLRTGIDPAHVLIQRTMPRYDLDPTRCEALWTYLVARS